MLSKFSYGHQNGSLKTSDLILVHYYNQGNKVCINSLFVQGKWEFHFCTFIFSSSSSYYELVLFLSKAAAKVFVKFSKLKKMQYSVKLKETMNKKGTYCLIDFNYLCFYFRNVSWYSCSSTITGFSFSPVKSNLLQRGGKDCFEKK